MGAKAKKLYQKIGLPRIIIISFFLVLLFSAGPLGLSIPGLISDVINRGAMYGILVLAMVPAVQSGIGLNFGISLGIVGGLLGALISIQMGIAVNPGLGWFAPWMALIVAILLGVLISSIIGWGYGLLLNRVKGDEMTVSTYVGFSIIAFMNIMWLALPFTSGELIWPLGGEGLRNTIGLETSFGSVLNNAGGFYIGGENGVYFPTGLVLFFLVACLLMWLFLRSKKGMALSAVGNNPVFAQASGINVNRMRILGTVLSTALGAVGIIVYAQSYGFLQLYNAPLMMGFHCVAAVLIGGATTKRSRISHVILGAFLFQGVLAVALPVANLVLPEGNLSEVARIVISNGIILYALTKTGGNSRE